jgi:hypothetical protein
LCAPDGALLMVRSLSCVFRLRFSPRDRWQGPTDRTLTLLWVWGQVNP